uniref:ASPSCR1 tether for SLC2A4, UBX domain containing n=1 Tax=Myripristis murdjan TaxID=586833 RepID=A0A667WUM2_9TELE
MAASSTAVTVLTPNGRRQTVKVSPNTPLLQVLEDVCKKHGFNPDDHGLKFQRNVLDLTLPWRFASVPNNAKLEMVPSTRKQAGVDSQVRIALQMEDGSRLQGSFSCGQNLWELLTHFPQTGCVCVKKGVCWSLKNATLKSLGLTGGSAIVRFLLKKSKTPEEEDGSEAMETVVTPITPVAKESPPSPPSRRDVAPPEPETSAEVPIKASGHDKPAEAPTPASAPGARPAQQEAVPAPQDVVRPKVCPVRGGMQEEDGEEAGPSGLNSCHTSSSSSSAPFIPFSGGGQRLGGPGGGGAGSSVSSSSSSSSLSTMAALGGSPKAKKAKPSNGVNAKVRCLPVDREPLVYHLDSESHYSQDNQDLPDEFFEVTVDDVRKRFAQLKSERRLLEEAPLMTKALRETQMKEKMDRYPKVVLRVQFPDRHVLQGFFRPLETVAAVRHFVRSHLENPELSFYLCEFHSVAQFFIKANIRCLLPTMNMKMKNHDSLMIQNRISVVLSHPPLSCMPRSPAAPSSGTPHLSEPPPPAEPAGNSGTSGEHDEDPAAHSQAPRPAQPDLGKVPKWLKLPGENWTGHLQRGFLVR